MLEKKGMKATVSRFAPSLTWVGGVRPNMDWSGYIVRLNMLTSDLTSGFSALFSHWLQVRKVGTVYLKRYYPHMKATARFKRELTTVFPALLLQGCHDYNLPEQERRFQTVRYWFVIEIKYWEELLLPNLILLKITKKKKIIIPTFSRAPISNRELKKQRRRRQQKRHLKSEFALPQTLSRWFHLVQFVKFWHIFLE